MDAKGLCIAGAGVAQKQCDYHVRVIEERFVQSLNKVQVCRTA